jgi:hypothetical protein
MEFVSDLVASLAWPITALVAGWFLRDPIKSIARNMGRASVTRAKVAGFELEFGAALTDAIQDAADISQEPAVVMSGRSSDQLGDSDLDGLLAVSPRAAMLESFARIEKALWDLGRPAGGVDLRHPRRESARMLASRAVEDGRISRSTFDAILKLAQARNLVAHGLADALPDEAAEFVAVARTVLLAIDVAADLQDRGADDVAAT